MVSVLQRARDSGRCPPSLLTEDRADPDGFEDDVLKLLDSTGFGLSSEPAAAEIFDSAVKKATNIDGVEDTTQRAAILELRRCLLLAIAGSTSPSSKTLERVLANGFLTTIKSWLDDTLAGRIGGIDLLLHMLTNIVDLPVTKAMVKDSGMGKAIGTIEKHSLCRGTPNEKVIQERVANIKEAWQASVKARKSQEAADSPITTKITKREASPAASSSSAPPAKKAKVERGEESKKSSFSTLLKKVSGSNAGPSSTKNVFNLASNKNGTSKNETIGSKKKSNNRVKWSDHFGGALETSRVIEGENGASVETNSSSSSVSWTDRKKRDRAREKELLASVKKAKLLDDEEDEPSLSVASMKTTVPWSIPSKLPERSDVTKPVLNSAELQTQNDRIKLIAPVSFLSDGEVPSDPKPLSEVEQALDMTAQSSAVKGSIPFFVPQQQPEPAPAPVAPSLGVNTFSVPENSASLANTHTPAVASTGATPEFLQALGLPIFLVGQDVNALQTLASSPGLLSTMVNANGMYDQTRLLSLVQTLSGAPSHHPDPSLSYNPVNSAVGGYGGAGSSMPMFTPSPTYGGGHTSAGHRSKSEEGNLHIAGYGPGTTQTDIITLFLPYVKVNEVVMKGTFAFVNTSDPVNAQRAKEALQGTLLNGMPIRINPAQRKVKDSSSSYGPPTTSTSYGPSVGAGPSAYDSVVPNGVPAGPVNDNYPVAASPAPPPLLPQHTQPPQLVSAHQNVDNVRDDRGNPATKNLFVAGYGPGTSEQQLRDVFNLHASVIGVVLKGNFTFVNTSTKQEAVNARQMLQGTTLNGGTLRINFAKETGRLGTSFDLTYNQQSGPNAKRGVTAPSYYGRGF